MQKNPFTPTFGIVPKHLAGRSELLDDMRQAFVNGVGDPNLSSVLIGARGCGKTALLSCIADEARQSGWIAVTVAAAPGMLEDILQRTFEASSHLLAPHETRHLTGFSIAQVVGLEWTLQPGELTNWRSRMNALLDELDTHGAGLLVCVDEVSAEVEELIQLVTTYQLLIGEGRQIALVMAGLPKSTTDLIDDNRISFLRRSKQRRLGAIPSLEVENAIRMTIEDAGKTVDNDALTLMVDSCQGFAYMTQLVGYCTWLASGREATITAEHARQGIERAQTEFESSVLDSTYRDMSSGDRAFAKAMLPDPNGSTLTDVAKRMGKGTNYASTYKTRLMKQGVISERAGKTFDFDLPGIREYLAGK